MEQYKPQKRFSSVFYENSQPGILYIYRISGEKSDALRAIHSHTDMTEIIYVLKGTGFYLIGTRRYIVGEGDIIILNSNVIHEEYLGEKSLHVISLGINNLRLKGLPSNTLLRDDQLPILRKSKTTLYCGKLIEMIYWSNAERIKGRDESCHYLLRALITTLCNNALKKGKEKIQRQGRALTDSICLYINNNFDKELSLNVLAALFHVNKYHLSHVFKDNMQISITDYILHRRIGEAQSKLLETDYSISQISDYVGFSNIGYFDRQFKKIVGMTPNEYRNFKNFYV